jgi:hypothetical protein
MWLCLEIKSKFQQLSGGFLPKVISAAFSMNESSGASNEFCLTSL